MLKKELQERVDYFTENIGILIDKIQIRHYIYNTKNLPIAPYEKEILRILINIYQGKKDPLNKR